METFAITVIPFKGSDKIKLNISRNELNSLYSNLYAGEFKRGNIIVDDYRLFHAFLSENGTVDALEFWEPSVYYNGVQLIGLDYEECKKLFLKDDPNIKVIKFDDEVMFRSLKNQICIYGPYGKVESVMVAKEGYFQS